MAKISINVPDAYEQALGEWANELGDKKGTLAAHLVRLAIEAKYPDKFPSAPPTLHEERQQYARVVPKGTLLSDLLAMASNLGGGTMSVRALTVQSLEGHFAKFTRRYHTKIIAFAAKHGLSFEQAYVLLISRLYPYSDGDIQWAREQSTIITEEQFLGGQMGRDIPPASLDNTGRET